VRQFAATTSRLALVLVLVGLAAVVLVLRPLPPEPAALAALVSGPDVAVSQTSTTLTLTPAAPSGTGFVFLPGARVDPRAYASLLRQVAAAGSLVVVVKPPLALAPLAGGAVERVVADHPEVSTWVIGGHSVGAVRATTEVAAIPGRFAGLLLWAPLPGADLSALATLPVTAILGTADAYATAANVADTRALLPTTTTYVVLDGAVHRSFGDYAVQVEVGVPGAPEVVLDERIVSASIDLVDRAASQ